MRESDTGLARQYHAVSCWKINIQSQFPEVKISKEGIFLRGIEHGPLEVIGQVIVTANVVQCLRHQMNLFAAFPIGYFKAPFDEVYIWEVVIERFTALHLVHLLYKVLSFLSGEKLDTGIFVQGGIFLKHFYIDVVDGFDIGTGGIDGMLLVFF